MKATIQINQIGIAILSTDRVECTQRLLQSIERHTKTNKLSVFVCDDSKAPNKKQVLDICQRPWIQFQDTGNRIGVARNTNFAIKALEPFKYKLILNNDVEVLKDNWAFFYPIAMMKTGFHHFCFQQEGLWGAGTKKRPERVWGCRGCTIKTIDNFPQGALLAYDKVAEETVGFFDAATFLGYGKSHWDWSFRVSDSGIQSKGIHDVLGSNKYFRVYDEMCATPIDQRIADYSKNTDIFNQLRATDIGQRIYIPYA